MNQDDVRKHRKRTDSDVSKAKNKAKHKHHYFDAIVSVDANSLVFIGSVCDICGKISDLRSPTEKLDINGKSYRRMLFGNEIKEKYKDLKEYHIDRINQKYVDLEENNNE